MAFFEWLVARKFGGRRIRRGDGLRAMLNNRCPVCGESPGGHSFAEVAAFPITSMGARSRVLQENPSALPHDVLPNEDAISYYLIRCGRQDKLALIEITSRIALFSPDAADRVTEITESRLHDLGANVENWMPFD